MAETIRNDATRIDIDAIYDILLDSWDFMYQFAAPYRVAAECCKLQRQKRVTAPSTEKLRRAVLSAASPWN